MLEKDEDLAKCTPPPPVKAKEKATPAKRDSSLANKV
jgi:hypothetical protein